MTRSALKCRKCNQSVERTSSVTKGYRVFSTFLHFLHLFLKNFIKQKNMTETLCENKLCMLLDLSYPLYYLYINNNNYNRRYYGKN